MNFVQWEKKRCFHYFTFYCKSLMQVNHFGQVIEFNKFDEFATWFSRFHRPIKTIMCAIFLQKKKYMLFCALGLKL